MGTNTATVETLTAEVTVLMVGSRQVTLSVARQLDKVGLQRMTPFGRVMLDRNDQRYCLIGKDNETGALVLGSGPRRFMPSVSRPTESNRTGFAALNDVLSNKQWDEWDRETEIRDGVRNLPLIVLAGLK